MDNDIDPMKINDALAGAGITPSAEEASGPVGDTVAIPSDAPEARIPDTPMGDPGALDAPAEAPAEESAEAPAEGPLPTDQSQWEQTTIVEGLGTSDQHKDPFWRYKNFGVEQDQSGAFEAYAIVDETPMMLEGTYESFEEAVNAINGELSHKKLSSGEGSESASPAQESGSEEGSEDESSAEGEGSEKEDSAEDEPEKEAPKEDAPKENEKSEEKEKSEGKPEDKPKDKEKTKPSKKSVSGADDTDSFRNMMGAYWSTKTGGVNNMPRTPRSLRDVAKSQNRTATVGGVTVRIGYDDRDAIDMTPHKTNRNDGSYKHIDPSVRNAMAPAKQKSVDLNATSTDALYDNGHKKGNTKTGVPSVQGVY